MEDGDIRKLAWVSNNLEKEVIPEVDIKALLESLNPWESQTKISSSSVNAGSILGVWDAWPDQQKEEENNAMNKEEDNARLKLDLNMTYAEEQTNEERNQNDGMENLLLSWAEYEEDKEDFD